MVLSREPDTLLVLASLPGRPCQGDEKGEEGAIAGWCSQMAGPWMWVLGMGALSCVVEGGTEWAILIML